MGTQMLKLRKQYGSIFSFKYGQLESVLISDPKVLKQVLASDDSAARPHLYYTTNLVYMNQNIGLICSEGDPWKEQRRFCLKSMRDFGFGKTSMEVSIMAELEDLVGSLKPADAKAGESFVTQLDERVAATVLNSLWMIVAGSRLHLDDPEFQHTLKIIQIEFNPAIIASMFPSFIPFLPMKLIGMGPERRNGIQRSYAWMKAFVDHHKETLDPSSSRDFVDAYLIEQIRLKESGNSDHSFTDLNLQAVLFDLFVTGAETTSTGLKWFFLYMVEHPEIQAKVHEEIEAVIGVRAPEWNDHLKMHYTQAAIHEMWRIPSVAPAGIEHLLLKDKEIGGYLIPKGTMIQGLIYAIHTDPTYWKDPMLYNPNRFLNESGEFHIEHKDAYLPFEIGKRQCLGENVARITTFLAVATLLQKFRFRKVPGKKYNLEPKPNSNVVNGPFPYEVLVEVWE
ncbi:unnamed protein product [Notodromas monacha]|uniref:Cytochrome P450 n=1 Tax=Notodromas monacha TaxID=399045 RepID=A0A7R9GDD0_9CRUS|nr:unnamed protein product [Notodromas monacha]CAG0918414.1 unnamed protein product [Notodromas monacha]